MASSQRGRISNKWLLRDIPVIVPLYLGTFNLLHCATFHLIGDHRKTYPRRWHKSKILSDTLWSPPVSARTWNRISRPNFVVWPKSWIFSMPKYVTSDLWQETLIKSRIILVSSSTHSYKIDSIITYRFDRWIIPFLHIHTPNLSPGVVLLPPHPLSSCFFKPLSLEKVHR